MIAFFIFSPLSFLHFLQFLLALSLIRGNSLATPKLGEITHIPSSANYVQFI